MEEERISKVKVKAPSGDIIKEYKLAIAANDVQGLEQFIKNLGITSTPTTPASITFATNEEIAQLLASLE